MTKTNFSRKAVVAAGAIMAVAAVPAAFMAYGDSATTPPAENPLEPYCLTVTANTTGTFSNAPYIGEATYTDADGKKHSRGTFGFNFVVSSEYVDGKEVPVLAELELRYAKAGEDKANLYLPDAIKFDPNGNGNYISSTLSNLTFKYYTPEQGSTEWNTFVDSHELKNVYVSPSTTSVNWYGEDFLNLRNFHFRSQVVPNFRFENGSNGTINIYVPENLFDYYASVTDGADYTVFLRSESPAQPTYVNVDIPGTLADAIATNIENLNTVRWLVLTGTPNEQDLRMMRRLPRLEILDLSAVTGLTTMVGCNGLNYLSEVILPEGLKKIGDGAFQSCTALSSIKLPSTLKSIENSSFASCRSLLTVELPPSTNRIGGNAFVWSGLTNINLEMVDSIEGSALRYCNLKKVNLANIKYLGETAFGYNYSLQEVNFGSKLKRMEFDCFSSCDLRKVVLPDSFERMDWGCFSNNSNLTEVEIGNGFQGSNGNSFYGSSIEKVTVRALFPASISGFSDVPNATLYVPALTLNEYLLSDAWTMFKNIKPLEEDLTDVTIDRKFLLTSDKGIAKNATLRLYKLDEDYNSYTGGKLTVRRNINAPLNLGKYSQWGGVYEDGYWDNSGYVYITYYRGSTLIPYSEMTAENVELKLSLSSDRWHFISLPFDVKVSDIKVTDETLWVVRKYSGADRAALKETTWQNMTDNDVLKAGEGYIFHCARGNNSRAEFTFYPTSAAAGNKLFAKSAVVKTLDRYPSEYAHNASWNLVGNTFPAFMNIRALGFNAPITLYNGSTYVAYSPEDDDLVLDPFQAFFVQRQDVNGINELVLNPEGRAHTKEEAAALEIERKKAPAYNAPVRSLFNIHINGETGTDRTRVVINESASFGYEASCDAAKFMSGEQDVPQIFVVNDNCRMAIDERPLGEGEIKLGASFGKSGEYTISLDTRNAEEYTVLLIDNKTGVTTDLTAGDYTFEADAAIDENRFTLKLNASTNAAEAISAEAVSVSVDGNVLSIVAPEEIEIAVVAADGKQVAAGRTASFTAVLEKGIYVVKAGELTKKVIITQ